MLRRDFAVGGDEEKPHYYVLDGLRGVAALVVLAFHIFEAFATSPRDQIINHGYLAVDFFFMLSGFVMSYAYDNRWGEEMNYKEFFLRRLIRLHPMVVIGTLLGGIFFYFGGSDIWQVSEVSPWALAGAVLLNLFLIPALPSYTVRGFGEMFPLNGPSWSLFFEYIGNILYALLLRRFSKLLLGLFTLTCGIGLFYMAFTSEFGTIGWGWTLMDHGFLFGLLRLLFSFSMGLWLSRIFSRVDGARGMLFLGGGLLVAIAARPHLGAEGTDWYNAIFDVATVGLVFPLIIYLAASEQLKSEKMVKLCRYLGELSYPLYLVHYPLIYVYFAWVKNNELSFVESLPGAVALVVASLLLAVLCLKYYDRPLRRWLSERWLKR